MSRDILFSHYISHCIFASTEQRVQKVVKDLRQSMYTDNIIANLKFKQIYYGKISDVKANQIASLALQSL
jgi:hypothetical protein